MLFEKENQTVDIQISKKTKEADLWLALYESWEVLRINWLKEIRTTLGRISFLEAKGFRVHI